MRRLQRPDAIRQWLPLPLFVALLSAALSCNTLPQEEAGAPTNSGALGALDISTDSGDTPTGFTFSLRIARHVDQPFSDARMDAILAQASAILQQVDFDCPDVATPVTFARDGTIDTFDIGSAIVTSEPQLDSIFSQPENVKIVTSMIGVCGAQGAPVFGCGFEGGTVVITQDAPFDVWAHEWGHVQGLDHRDDCFRNIMHTFELQTDAVNTTERDAFLSPTPGAAKLGDIAQPLAQPLALANPLPSADVFASLRRSENEPLDIWVNDWLSRRYLAGVPEEIFDGEQSPELTDLLLAELARQPEGFRQLNVLRALGFAGDPFACPALIGFLDSQNSPMHVNDLNACAEALLALGRLSAADGSDVALDYLMGATDAETWRPRHLELVFADSDDSEQPSQDLSEALARISVMGLGYSVHPGAHDFLVELRGRIATQKVRDPWYPTQVEEALLTGGADAGALRRQSGTLRQP